MGGRRSPNVRVSLRPAPQPTVVRRAVREGRAHAKALLTKRRRAVATKRAVQDNGVLVAEGDSWFNYPFFDVLEALEDDFGYEIDSVAHAGDTLESMAYDDAQFTALRRRLERLKQHDEKPRAILLSGGGNDIAGDQFAMLLNHASSQLPPLNAAVVDGVIAQRLSAAYGRLIGKVTGQTELLFGHTVPIVVHGYAHPVPDGRGYLSGFWVLPGPWLEPGFRQKGYANLPFNTQVMKIVIDAFNGMLASVVSAAGLAHVRYLDLRADLSNELPAKYRQSWDNELHPTRDGFKTVARSFDQLLRTFPKP
jgi:lysophospholipase L1-like esterase